MAVRIYVLARDLKLDSKELIEYCKLAGIEGKGSALASLTDEERDQVVAAMRRGGVSAAPPASTASETAAAPAPIKRTDYVPASGVGTKVPPIASPRGSGDQERKAPARKRDMPRPRVAPAPSLRPPPPAASKPEEPAAQKPVIRLPRDAITDPSRKPLEEHIRRHEEKRKAEKGKEREAVAEDRFGAAEPPVRPGPLAGREDRKRRRGHREMERRQQRQGRLQLSGDEEDTAAVGLRRRRTRLTRTRGARPAEAIPRGKAHLEGLLTVRAVSEAFGVPSNRLLEHMIRNQMAGLDVNINSTLDDETVQLLGLEFGVELEIKRQRDLVEELRAEAKTEEAPESLQPRPPVATMLGHVDHGKTSLLDSIRKTNVVAGEAGGITQHIGAYQIDHEGQKITFLDTPGHAAFTAMRARGANVTDIAILVIAADDGVMPQTEEAISHARAADVPIIVALNKCDLATADIQRVFAQLATNNLLPHEWGGDTEVIQTSALTGEGIDQLLSTLVTLAELRELKANPNARASGVCLEASKSEERGVLSTFLVQRGTLAVGDVVWCGDAEGKIRTMHDDQGRPIGTATPATPVVVTGLNVAPSAGEHFYVVDDRAQARQLAEGQQERRRAQYIDQRPHITLESFSERRQAEQIRELNLILKGDTRGSLEAIRQELEKLVHPEVRVKVLHQGVGAVNESDIRLADASDAVVLAFHSALEDRAVQSLAESHGVQIRTYEVIYELIDDVRKALEGLIAPEQREVEIGRAAVLRTFRISRLGTVAGCRVTSGNIERNARIRILRDGAALGTYPIASLRREKDDVRSVRDGLECGIRLSGFDDLLEGDELVAFRIEEHKRTL